MQNVTTFLRIILSQIVNFKRAAQNLHDRLARIERTIRILKNQLDRLANIQHAIGWHLEEILAVKNHLAIRGLDQSRDESGRRRLTTATLAH